MRRITMMRRFNASLMAIFGLVGVLIGAAGVYAVTSSVVSQQTREIGLRMALGATPQRVARQVLASALVHISTRPGVGLAHCVVAIARFWQPALRRHAGGSFRLCGRLRHRLCRRRCRRARAVKTRSPCRPDHQSASLSVPRQFTKFG